MSKIPPLVISAQKPTAIPFILLKVINFLNIAHELGHATGQYQQINRDKNNLYQFDTPQAYGMARAKAEGEATYYEFLVAKEFKYQRFVKPLWLDNAAKPQDKDVFNEVDEIMRQAISENDKITQLAVLNQSMLPSGQFHAPLYTYDEYNTLVFLNNVLLFRVYRKIISKHLASHWIGTVMKPNPLPIKLTSILAP